MAINDVRSLTFSQATFEHAGSNYMNNDSSSIKRPRHLNLVSAGLRVYAQRAASRPSLFERERKDPAKMTYSRMDLAKRGLVATAASAKSK